MFCEAAKPADAMSHPAPTSPIVYADTTEANLPPPNMAFHGLLFIKNHSPRGPQQARANAISKPAVVAMNSIDSTYRAVAASLLGAMLLFTSAAAVSAQIPVSPDNTNAQAVRAEQSTADLPHPSPTIAPIEPPSLIPPNTLPGPGAAALPQIPSAPELDQLNALFRQTSLGKAADEHRLHVQMAELEVQIRNDRDLHQLRHSADEARTDLERRHRFRTYYEHYFGKLLARAQAPELKDYLKAQEAAHELVLLQPRVRHETDEAEASTLAQARAGASVAPLATPTQAKVNNIFRP